MEQRKEALLLTTIALGYKYGNYKLNLEYFNDEEVMDCKFKLYALLLSTEEKEQIKKIKEFQESYKVLSKEKQEYIREDLRKIFKEQDKNNKEKEKKI